MYSGSDSTESQKFPQWALNPSTYKNMANDQVDWAALAQQWIIMKEAGPPPVPGEQPVLLNKNNKKEDSPDRGEAPMDMEDKDSSPSWPGPPKVASGEWGWNNQNPSWNNSWNNAWNGPPPVVPPPAAMMKPPLLPTPKNYNELSAPPESSSDNAVPFAGTAQSNDYSPVYWTNNRVIKPRNKRYSKVNVPTAVASIVPLETPPTESPPTLDAAKRKQLPAWIREGLEKMERDKLKQLEREKEKFEREVFHEKIKQTEKEKMEILKTTMQEQQQKSKFESDGELSDEEEQTQDKSYSYKQEPVLTQEELMLKVRRTMTEVLLKVTNAEIATIAKEESIRWIKKLKASDHRSSAPSGANITAKLGLGMYGEGSDSSSEDSEDEYLKEKRDSDSELKDIIRKKVSDFTRTEREIEEKLAEAESKKGGYASRDSSPDSSQNESQVDARTQGRRKKSNDTTPPRPRQRSASTSSDSQSPAYVKGRPKPSRRSSSSSESAHSRRSTRKRSRTRSRSPKRQKHKQTTRRRSRSASRDRKTVRKRQSRSRSRSYSSRSRRSRSPSYRRSRRSYSKERHPKRGSRSRSRSSHRSNKRRRSRSGSAGARGKRSHRY